MKRYGRLVILVLAIFIAFVMLPGRQAAAQGGPVNLTIVKETDPDGGVGFPFTLTSNGLSTRTWGTSGSGNGQFSRPVGVAVDSTGNVYVADQTNNRIQKFSRSGTYLTKWGTAGSGNGQFKGPWGVAVDAAGNVYVAETGNNRIQKFSSSGTYLTKWGTAGSGNGQFSFPTDVAIDSAGNVYVADLYNHRIQKFSSSGTYLTKWGTYGTGNGQFNNPVDVAVDQTGNVYVADELNHRIQKFTNSGTFLTKWGTAGSGNGQLQNPAGVAFDSAGNVYVAEWGNNRVQKFRNNGTYLTKWGTSGSGNGQFNGPIGLAADSAGNVYVTDTRNYRVQKFVDASTKLNDDQSVTYALDPAKFTLTESVLSGWNLASIICSGGSPQVTGSAVALTLTSGNHVTCTFTNTQPNTLTVVKNVVGGATPWSYGFTGGLGAFNLTNSQPSKTVNNLAVGNVTINETAVPGFSQAVSCTSGETGTGSVTVRLDGGENVTCTFTNTATGSITVVKNVVGGATPWSYGFTGGLGAFNLTNTQPSKTFSNLAGGSVNISETAVPGYSQSVSCDSGESGTGSVTVALAPGENVVCTFTNTADPGSITIVKTVVGQAPGSDWAYTGDLGSFTLPAAGGQTAFDTLAAGSYTVNETAVSGYSQSVSCDSGETGTGSVTVNLAPGEDVVCTFTNTADAGSITIIKTVVGQAPSSDWAYTGDLGSFTLPAAGGQTAFDTLAAGSYTVNETAVSGYSQSVSCDSGETGTGSVTVDLAPGEDVVCTFTNTADAGSITIVKTVVGATPSADWSFTGDLGSFTLPAAGGQTAFDTLAAGSYTVNETAVAGYSQSVSCDSGETGTGSVTVDLAPGEDVVCTFTNTADAGSITIVKTVVGQIPGSDWSYTGDLGSFTLPAAGGQTAFDTLAAGSYTVNETAVAGYSQSVSCDSGETGTGSVTVDLAPGEDVVCTFTNTADPGSITIVKSVVGQAPGSDWSYTGDLGSFTLPAAGGQSVFDTLGAGSYTVNETAVAGYSQSVSCDSGESGTGSVTVDLAPGEDVVCTFTNTADAGSITIVKTVVGATPSADWAYTGDLGSFTLPAAGGQTAFDTLAAGSYTVNETAVAGYSQSVSCDSGESGTGSVTVDLAPGEDVVCTFTNTADAGSITIVKTVVGQVPGSDWSYTGDLGSFTLPAAGGQTAFDTLAAGSYTVNETAVSGYTQAVSCDSGETGTGSVTIDLAPGEDVVCTFTNTADPGSITIVKTVVGQVPGSDWSYTGDLGSFTLPAAGGQTAFDTLGAGSYTVNETAVSGYSQSVSCDSGETGTGSVTVDLAPGEDVVCTFTNTADAGSITIIKTVVGQAPSSDWSYTGDLGSFTLPAAGGQTAFDTLAAGSYTVNETAVSGYSQSVSCDSGESGTGSVTVDLAPGEDVVCTFTNTADPGSITVTKEIVGAGTGTFTICVDSDCKSFNGDGAQQTWSGLAPGQHTVSEQDAGPLWTEPVARTVSLLPGQSVLVTVTNIYEGTVAGFCPVDENVGLHQTVLLGRGQSGRNGRLIIPNYTQVEALYGQLAAVDVGLMKFVRFTYPNKAKVQLYAPVSPAYRQAAVSWWGSELDPAKSIQGQFFWGKKGNKSPRAFVLWPTYTTAEQYADVLTLFDASSENHVSWKPGWIPEQVQTISLPPTQAAGASVRVQIALVDINKDKRPVVMTIEAGGVSMQRVIVGPNRKNALNVEEFLLENLPAGTDEVTITLLSPKVSSQYPFGGDSAAVIGAAVSYACVLP